MTTVHVLYEDSQAAGENNFGPHILLLACLGDRRNQGLWDLRDRFSYVCRNGVDKLISTATRFGRRETRILAPDDDRIREHLQLAHNAAEAVVVTTLATAADSEPANVVLIVRNMDTVAETAATVVNLPPPSKKLRPRERDPIFHRLASSDANLRATFLERCASFARLVERSHQLLGDT